MIQSKSKVELLRVGNRRSAAGVCGRMVLLSVSLMLAAAAFRALSDIAVFDDRVDVRNLDLKLADCVADSSAAPAARTMAIQLCGERGIRRAIPNLTRICRDSAAGTTQRLAAEAALRQLTGEPSFQHMQKGDSQ